MPSLDDLMNTKPKSEITEAPPPPSSGQVTQSNDTTVSSNVVGKAEAQQQAEVKADTVVEAKPDYKYEIAYGAHKVVIIPEEGLNYNFHAKCNCAWEGRFMTSELAEHTAQKHVMLRNSPPA